MWIRRAELGDRLVDVHIHDGLIAEIAEVADHAPRGTGSFGGELDAAGGALLHGLHDHHVHLLAGAAALASVDAGPAAVRDAAGLASALRAADRALPPGAWLRAVGYHESVAGEIDAAWLEALGIRRPIRMQHRTGSLWMLNSEAVTAIGADARTGGSGRLFRADGWLGERVPHERPDLAPLGRRLVAHGITGVTDLTPTTDAAAVELLAHAVRRGDLPQRVVVTGAAALDESAGAELPRGPVKIVLADEMPIELDAVIAEVRAARARGRSVAIHAVTREALVVAIVALREVGGGDAADGGDGGDRIEHGAVIPVELLDDLVELAVTVVTQPNFVAERGDDYLRDVDRDDRPHLWRCGSLLAAGIPVAFGSDLPYGGADPWRAIATATSRRTAGGALLGPEERIDAAAALRAWLGPPGTPGTPRSVEVGTPADLVVLDRPLRTQLEAPTTDAVRCAIIGGVVRYERSG